MTIRYECQECGSVLKIKDDRAGQKGKCPKCNTPFMIPVPDQDSDAQASRTASAPQSEDDLVAAYLSEEADTKSRSRSKKPAFDASDEMEKPKPRATGRVLSRAAGSASGSAGDLLALSGKKARETEWTDPEPTDQEKAKQLATEVVQAYGRQAALPIVGVLVAVLVLYWVSSLAWTKRRDLPELVELGGVVKLDGKPVAGARVEFRPMQSRQPGSDIRVSSSNGKTDADGRYALKYSADVAGVAVGVHEVRITWYDKRGMQVLPIIYNTASKLSLQVKASGNKPADFNLVSDPSKLP